MSELCQCSKTAEDSSETGQYNLSLLQPKALMVCLGLEKSLKKQHVLEKSLKIEKLWDILGKPLNFSQKSSNIFESYLNKNNLCLKKVFCAKKRLNAQQYANFLGDQVSVRSTVPESPASWEADQSQSRIKLLV